VTDVVCIVSVSGPVGNYGPALQELRVGVGDARILLVASDDGPTRELAARVGAEISPAGSLAAAIDRLRGEDGGVLARHVVVVTAPVLVPPALVDRAGAAADEDLRIATVSFLSNNAGLASLPVRNSPTFHLLASHDQRTVTERLRRIGPDAAVASIPVPVGAVHLLSRHALAACGGLRHDTNLSANGLVTEFALRAQRRGFVCAVDPSTFVLATADLGATAPDPIDDPFEGAFLRGEHPFVEASREWAATTADSPTALVVASATAKITGLRVTIDGRCLGDREMGTQVQTLALARELAERDDVQVVTIATNGPVPGYASDVFNRPKVRHELIRDADVGHLPHADILHRPYQPDTYLPIAEWHRHASRVVVTLQDLIAYEVGAYAIDGSHWLTYRDALRQGSERADGVVVISNETKHQVAFERLNIAPDRLFVVPNGTDHLTGGEAESMPDALLRRGFGAGRFLFVLGANYAHKNRDLAVAAWQQLRASHRDVSLVLVGASVPYGSSRLAESAVTTSGPSELYVLPDVTSAERNWLLRNASVVLYPTSAEGFGLVPFEAARFGTPTVNVDFGPLREVNGSAEQPRTWAPADFARSIVRLLDDPSLATRRVAETLQSGARYTWAGTAQGLVDAYRDVLARPPLR